MFPAYSAGGGKKEEPPSSTNGNSDLEDAFNSYNLERIAEKRKIERERAKVEKTTNALKDFHVVRGLHGDSDDDDSDIDYNVVMQKVESNLLNDLIRAKPKPVQVQNVRKRKLVISDRSRRRSSSSDSRRKPDTHREVKQERRSSSSEDSHRKRSRSRDRHRRKKDRRARSRSRSRDRSSHHFPKKDKKKHKKKHRKRRKYSSSPSSSSSSDSDHKRSSSKSSRPSTSGSVNTAIATSDGKYAFLAYDEDKNVGASWIIYWRRRDDANFSYDHLYKGESSERRLLDCGILGGNAALNKIFIPDRFPTGREAIPRFHQAKPDPKKTEDKFRAATALHRVNGMDFVPLAKKFEEFRFLHEIEEEKALARSETERYLSGDTRSRALVDIQQRILDVKRKLPEARREEREALYADFIKLEEQQFEKQPDKQNRMALNERLLAILDQAIKHCPRSVELCLKKLDLMRDSQVDVKFVFDEWNRLLNVFVNSTVLWGRYLDFIQYDSRMYSPKRMEDAFTNCTTKLSLIKDGILVSHQPEAGTAEFLLEVFIRQMKWYLHQGYFERAMASIQASLEFRYCMPPSLVRENRKAQLAEFRKYWESGLPRIGDPGWKGWSQFYAKKCIDASPREMERYEIELEKSRIHDLRVKIGNLALNVDTPSSVNWVELERGVADLCTRPQRTRLGQEGQDMEDPEEEMDSYRVVPFDELRFDRSDLQAAVFSILGAFGAEFPAMHPANPSVLSVAQHWQRHIRLDTNTAEFPATVVERMVHIALAFQQLQPNSDLWGLVAVPTYALYVDQLSLSPKEKVKEMRPFMKNLLKGMGGQREQLYLLQWFEQLLSRGWCPPKEVFVKLATIVVPCLQSAEKLGGIGRLPYITAFVLFKATTLIVQYTKETKQVGDELARVILGRMDKKQVSAQDWLEAARRWEELAAAQISPFKDGEPASDWIRQQPPPNEMICALRMMFEYVKGGKQGREWLDRCRRMCQKVEQGQRHSAPMRMMLIDLMDRHWKEQRSFRSELVEECRRLVRSFPRHPLPLQKLVELSRTSLKTRAFFGRKISAVSLPKNESRRTASYHRAFARLAVYAANSVDSLNALPAQMISTSSSDAAELRDPYFWRLAMSTASGHRKQFEEAYVRGDAQCRWARDLHLDRILHSPGEVDKMRLHMMDSDLRLVTELEEIDLYRQAQEATLANEGNQGPLVPPIVDPALAESGQVVEEDAQQYVRPEVFSPATDPTLPPAASTSTNYRDPAGSKEAKVKADEPKVTAAPPTGQRVVSVETIFGEPSPAPVQPPVAVDGRRIKEEPVEVFVPIESSIPTADLEDPVADPALAESGQVDETDAQQHVQPEETMFGEPSPTPDQPPVAEGGRRIKEEPMPIEVIVPAEPMDTDPPPPIAQVKSEQRTSTFTIQSDYS